MIGLILSDILLAVNFSANKLYQKKNGSQVPTILKYNGLLGLFAAIIFLVYNKFSIDFTPYSLFMSVMLGLLNTGYTIVGFKIMQEEKLALNTLFLMLGGMLLPYLWGLIFLGEEVSALRTIGLLLIVVSMIIPVWGKNKMKPKVIAMCIAVFIMNGFVSIISKEHQINENAVASFDFVIMNNLSKAICSLIAFILCKKTVEDRKRLSISSYGYAFMAATSVGFASFLQLNSATTMPATVVYPVITGGTIIITAIAGWIFFKEKITYKLALSLGICFIGTCMFL